VSAKVAALAEPAGPFCLGQNDVSFSAVYQAEFAYVHRTMRRLGIRPADLDDLCHDLFVVVHRRLADFDPARPIRPWLFGIAYRVASDHRKRAHIKRELAVEVAEPTSGSPNPEQELAHKRDRELVLAALDTMDLDFRAAFVMHDIDGHSVPDISAALGVPLNTVYSRLRLAREKFAVAVKRLRAREGVR
jgi:RNA polymerase sigma-70 factor (ECF subfamily)